MRFSVGAPGKLFSGRTFTSLRQHYNYRLYFWGQFLSQIGTWLQSAAMAWLVLELTHSAFAVGIMTFWQFGPYLVLGLFGGALSDRLDHRITLIATQVALALCSGTIAMLTFLHVVTVWEAYVIAAIRGTVLILNNPSRQAFIFQMVGRKELPNAIALNRHQFLWCAAGRCPGRSWRNTARFPGGRGHCTRLRCVRPHPPLA